MAAVPSRGRANRIEGAPAPEADLTRALYEQYAAQILRYCLHQLGSREEAEDAVQSTFLNAFRGIKRGIVPELEAAWLFAIAHNVCLSRRRSTWRRGRIEAPTDFDVIQEVAPAPSRRADELIGLQDVLGQLPEQQRRAILLREWQGLSYREIADELSVSQSAVETLIFRARRSLAQGLEQPAAPKQRRRVHASAFGGLLSAAQSFLLGGGAAVKVAATVAIVGAGTVVATAPIERQPVQRLAPIGSHRHVAPARHVPTVGVKRQAVTRAPAVAVQRPVLQRPVLQRPVLRHPRPQHAPRRQGHLHAPVRHVLHAAAAPAAPLVLPAAAPQAAAHHDQGRGRGRSAAPGLLKHAAAPVRVPAAAAPPAPAPQPQPQPHGQGKATARGQAKKQQREAVVPETPAPPDEPPANGRARGKGK